MNIVEKKNTQLNDNLIKLLNENTDIIELIAKHKDMLNDILNNNVKNFEVQKIREGYTCQPKLKEQLQDIIIKRIETYGLDCDLNDIDVSKIKDMSNLFDADKNDIFKYFNGDISQWNVSNVVNMCRMFYGCKNFNCDLSRWNVSNVENMYAMFRYCTNFNGDISKWNVSNVKNMVDMFYECTNFRQNLEYWNIYWNISKCNMSDTFLNCPTSPTWYDRNRWE